MAGQEIYLGKMIEGLQADMAQMSADMVQMVTELQNVNNTVAQGISVLNIKTGDAVVVNLGNPEITKASGTPVKAFSFSAYAKGKAKIKYKAKSANAGVNVFVKYSTNGGSSWNDLSGDIPGTVFKDYEYEIPINPGVYDISLSGTSAYNVTIGANVTISYSLIDIVNEGAFAI